MKNLVQATPPEWATLIRTLQDTNMQVKETNQLTRALREEQRKAFQEMKENRDLDYEKRIQEYREMREIIREQTRSIQESGKRMDKESEEFHRSMAELREESKRTRAMIEETGRLQKETDRQMKETDKKIKELSTRFSSTTGNIIEGLMSSSSVDMFKKAGYDMHSKMKNMLHRTTNPNDGMEVDVLLYNDTTAIAIEVKASCDRKDIDRFLQQMGKFRKHFPMYNDKELLAAIAAVNYEKDADDYAHQCGLIVVRTDSQNFFAIDPCDKDALSRF